MGPLSTLYAGPLTSSLALTNTMEILVHVSAPSSAADDARYRAQIAAIMALQPVSAGAGPGPASAAATPATPSIPRITSTTRVASPAAPSNTQSAGTPGSPAAADRRPQSRSPSHPLSRPGQETGPGTGPAPDLQRVSSPARLDTIGPEALAPVPLVRLQQESASTSNYFPTSNYNSLERPVSVIPDSQPSEQPPNPSWPEDDPRAPTPPHPSPYRHSAQAKASLVPALQSDLASPRQPPKRRRLEAEAEAEGEVAAPNITTTAHDAPITSLLHSLPIKITPPPPPISTSPFITHITPTLSMLTQRLKPERIYKPLRQTRDLDKLERGYWALRIPLHTAPSQDSNIAHSAAAAAAAAAASHNPIQKPWDIPSFYRFWSFLSDFIGKDARAGWGVWCIVEQINKADPTADSDTKVQSQSHPHSLPSTASTDLDDPSPPPPPPPPSHHTGTKATTSTTTPKESPIPESLSLSLKMYAWGEVAMHVYLLLFLASERRVRGMGAEWRDSGEEVVINMP
ncbi:hypothetical protein N7481_000240 [Penicillium waksmanii]|uniref:uncharacterized protein n=1 Tax=Penicillium waksmanii TaxID=69791 RepID=UPI002549873E|nr:uncharacterized protein N7481_000240 [Penicillium waksmanii]KAJ5999831.1 hypothetical protein N7481_000240 [Penicillium waksmanii]